MPVLPLNLLRVSVQLDETSQPILHENVVSTYTKGPLYCVLVQSGDAGQVYKYPIEHLFRVTESYGPHT